MGKIVATLVLTATITTIYWILAFTFYINPADQNRVACEARGGQMLSNPKGCFVITPR